MVNDLPPRPTDIATVGGYVSEYARMKRNAELGGTFDINKIDPYVLAVFDLIATAVSTAERQKRETKKR